MAKQGANKIVGTIDGLTFYKYGNKYYIRAKSSLTGKRVKTDPCFKNTMQQATIFGKAAKLASVFAQKDDEEATYKLSYTKHFKAIYAQIRQGASFEEIKANFEEKLRKNKP